MPIEPPSELARRLERLGLCTGRQIRRVAGKARRLARDLPLLESVWIDALSWARVLTPYQAAQINAGRAEELRVGKYLLRQPLASAGYCRWFEAQNVDTGRLVQLAIREAEGAAGNIRRLLEGLRADSAHLQSPHLAPVFDVGSAGRLAWAAIDLVPGITVAEWLVRNGRFPPRAALEIARQMLAGLTILHRAGLCHGDIAARSVILDRWGRVVLLYPGLRPVLRPHEGFALDDLPPEGYDGVAPERVRDGAPVSVATDLYACGALWWHLLTGRPPLLGGSAAARLQATQTVEVPDVRQLAPEAPEPLATAIAQCLRREPGRRPQSPRLLADRLGSPTLEGRKELVRCVRRPASGPSRWVEPVRPPSRTREALPWLALVAGCSIVAAAVFWSMWSDQYAAPGKGHTASLNQSAASTTESTGIDRPKPLPQTAQSKPLGRGSSPQGPWVPQQQPDQIVRATYVETAPADEAVVTVADASQLLELLSQARSGQTIRPAAARLTVEVPPAGLVVDHRLTFENFDFVPAPSSLQSSQAGSCLIVVRVPEATFRHCFFGTRRHTSNSDGRFTTAVRWHYPSDPAEYQLRLPSGRLRLEDCVFAYSGAAVSCQTAGAMTIEMDNVLAVESSCLVATERVPRPDEALTVVLRRVTLRSGGPLWLCRYSQWKQEPGPVAIRTTSCVLTPKSNQPLLAFAGPVDPGPIVRGVRWMGEGSVVGNDTLIAAWQPDTVEPQPLDDAAISIAGLFRSPVTFAGPVCADPQASRTTGWQGPLLSVDPPGVEPDRLPTPPLDGRTEPQSIKTSR